MIGTNLVKAADDITYVPTKDLAGMIDNPNSRFPSYLVLSEVQRRNQLKKVYDGQFAAQQDSNTTVAQEAVAKLTGSGLAGASSNQQLSSPVMGESPVGGGVSASGLGGVQMMAEGGRVGYANRGRTGSEVLNSTGLMNMYGNIDINRLPRGTNLFELEDELNRISQINREPIRNKYREESDKYKNTFMLSDFDEQNYDKLQQRKADEEIANIIEKERMEAIIESGLGGTVEPKYSDVFEGQKIDTYIPKGESDKITTAGDSIDNLIASNRPEKYQERVNLGLVDVKKGIKDATEKAKKDGLSSANVNTGTAEANMQRILNLKEGLTGNTNFDNKEIKFDTSGLKGLLDSVPDFDRDRYKINFDAPTAEDRAKDRQVSMLTGLAQVFGTSKNLGEAGAGIGALGKEIQGMRKEARKEDLDLQTKQIQNEIAIDALAQGNRKEKGEIVSTIFEASKAGTLAEANKNLEVFKAMSSLEGNALTAAVAVIRDETQRNLIKANGTRTQIDAYSELSNQMDRLNDSVKDRWMLMSDEEKTRHNNKLSRMTRRMDSIIQMALGELPDEFSSPSVDMTADQYLGIN